MASIETRTERIDLSSVKRVVLRDYGQLILTQSDEASLRIEAQPDLLRMVHADVRQDELILDIQGGWFDKAWQALTSTFEGKTLKYFLTLPSIAGIFVSGAGRVKSQNINGKSLDMILKGAGEIIISGLEVEQLQADLPGAGVISLAGSTHFQQVHLHGAGSYDAPRLRSKEANIKLKGVGKASVWVTEKLDAQVDGVGSIDYYGDPVTRKNITGLGKINQRIT